MKSIIASFFCLFLATTAQAVDVDSFLKSAPGSYYDKYSNVNLEVSHDPVGDTYTFDCQKCSKDALPLTFSREQFQKSTDGQAIIGFNQYEDSGIKYYSRVVATFDKDQKRSLFFSDGPLGQGYEPYVANWMFGF